MPCFKILRDKIIATKIKRFVFDFCKMKIIFTGAWFDWVLVT